LLILLVTLISASATLLIAYFIRNSAEVHNKFIPAKSIDPIVEEVFNGTEKKDVKINVNKTEYPVYVRAKIIITWKFVLDDDITGRKKGDILFISPEEGKLIKAKDPANPDSEDEYSGDYIIDCNLFATGKENSWRLAEDGFYYYVDSKGELQAVESDRSTENLINYVKQVNLENAPEGYSLSVEIIAQTVQAIGSTDEPLEKPAYKDAWGDKAP
ncbi:MAG: hypothetical protein J1E34_10265, partial [Oscillospiraceae bacterium]|nr:hypothetical protein [Oscillospiraceae bacterium]